MSALTPPHPREPRVSHHVHRPLSRLLQTLSSSSWHIPRGPRFCLQPHPPSRRADSRCLGGPPRAVKGEVYLSFPWRFSTALAFGVVGASLSCLEGDEVVFSLTSRLCTRPTRLWCQGRWEVPSSLSVSARVTWAMTIWARRHRENVSVGLWPPCRSHLSSCDDIVLEAQQKVQGWVR